MMDAMLVSSWAPWTCEKKLSSSFIYHIQNKIPHKKIGKTPYKLWKGYTSNITYLKVWGCLAKVPFLELKKQKLGLKNVYTVFMRYLENSATNMFLVIKSENHFIEVNTVVETKNTDFFENIFLMKPK